MRVTLLAVGSHGDVRPYVALGTGLARLGHDVRLASHAPFKDLAVSNGLAFAAIEGNPRDIVLGPEGQAWLESANNPLLFLKRTSRIAAMVLDKLSDDALGATRGSDAIVYSMPLASSGYSIAEALRIPGVPAALYPLHPTCAFASVLASNLPLRCGLANWASGFAVAQLFWQVFRSSHNRWRRRALGLGPAPVLAPLAEWENRGVPFLYGYSPSFLPVPGAWGPTRAVTGYWFLDRPKEWVPPAGLLEFLDAGPPPLYAGFGSMAESDNERLTTVVLQAVRRTGCRAVLAAGWGGLAARDLPREVFPIGSVPHDWLLPRVSVAIHHGGAGTTAAALRAGVPSVVVPFFADQFFWGSRVARLGLGPRPIPRKELSAEALCAAIARALRVPLRERCTHMAARIQAEDGIRDAAARLDCYLSTTRRTRR